MTKGLTEHTQSAAYWRDGVSLHEPFESGRHDLGKTPRSEALRGGLREGHTGAGITRLPIVDRSDVRISRTAAMGEMVKAERCFSGLTKGSRSEMPSLRSPMPLNRRKAGRFHPALLFPNF